MNLTAMLQSMGDEEDSRIDILKMPFSYPGSKQGELKYILPHLPHTDLYGEPFGGSGAVLMNKRRCKNEVFNDRYSGAVDFFRIIRNQKTCDEFCEKINLMMYSREEYIWNKKTWQTHQDIMERALRWYYMARYAMIAKTNGAFGRQTTAITTFPFGLTNKLNILPALRDRLFGVTLENLDWRRCLTDYDCDGRVWYLDPTYLGADKGCYIDNMDEQDHIEMCERIFALSGYVALSGYYNDETRNIYDKYKWNEIYTWDRVSTAVVRDIDTQVHTGSIHVKEGLWIKH